MADQAGGNIFVARRFPRAAQGRLFKMLAVKPLLQFHQPFTGEVTRAIDHRLQRGLGVRGVLHQRIERFEEILRCVVVAVQRFDAYHLIVNIEENGGLTQGVDIGCQPFETGDKAGKLIENLGAPVRPFFPQARSQTTKVNARGIQAQFVQTADLLIYRFAAIAVIDGKTDNPLQLSDQLFMAVFGKTAAIRFDGFVGF